MVEIKRKKGEPSSSVIHRFISQVTRSGIILEARKKLFYTKPLNKREKKEKALLRKKRSQEIMNFKKIGKNI
ncbi:MAG: 30S ribosomal protein S21 [Candidatus Pacebacteria bacterium]|nr:30S ribosomal protein S21 [Candidatus Paceibacterota bacterium]